METLVANLREETTTYLSIPTGPGTDESIADNQMEVHEQSSWGPNDRKHSVIPEQELVALAQNGDGTAFDELVHRHQYSCLRRARRIMNNLDDAEDEMQNALWRAFECLEQFRNEGTFGAWLNRIVENECFMRIRARRRSVVYLDQSTKTNGRLDLVSQDMGPEDEVGHKELAALICSEISKLPLLMKGVLLLRDVEGLSLVDTATRLNVSVPAAKSRLARARIELRARLARHCGRKGPCTLTQRHRYPQLAFTAGSMTQSMAS